MAQKNVNMDFDFDEFYRKELCAECKLKYEAAIGRMVLAVKKKGV